MSDDDPLKSRWSQLERLDDARADDVWRWFVRSYEGFVTRLLASYGVRDSELAASEFWTWLFERRAHVAGADRARRFRAWLVGFVRNFARERRRATAAGPDVPVETPDAEDSSWEALETRLWADAVLQLGLDEVDRAKARRGEVLRLFYGIPPAGQDEREPLGVSAIARELGLAIATISPMLTEARKLLRQAIERHLRETVATRADLTDEVRVLIDALRAPHPGLVSEGAGDGGARRS